MFADLSRHITFLPGDIVLTGTPANSRPMQPGDVRQSFADIDAISGDLGYKPTTSIDVGVPNFVRWYKDYHGL